ncbi:large conductance mechanosensitive channel protein MscL [Pseudobacter ginsenosidimutans]|uniref:Large-conductance mechanosensitive channel n=1 Tax=Pseudobacter ginsenosidimutans TaxID=661488 RepID=A0A4Q7MRB3_9BACT|nr:large conductance mechanosensitive channel protein MscL [Pseudobacter ginsenosidimutans]QEC41877.1 large conductance mechanosensitive channel protein MscL [Pseudobacter ginsenosidimutans]RZS71302.1 large conductance mechanosensitive channel [Pseudobacter ginsenosidimutans]
MGMLKDFKDFALKGNVVDLAVAVIIGGAFGTIVSSLVDDVITPLLLTPALKFANAENIDTLSWGAVKYGKFLSAIIKFIIIAWILFLLVRGMKKLTAKKDEAPAAPPAPTATEQLLMEIRDELKKK